MKVLIIGLLSLIVSCGDTRPGSSSQNRVGEVRSLLTPALSVSGETRTSIVAICNALAQKESILGTALNSIHTFTVKETDCQGKTISSGDVAVSIQSTGQAFVFRKTNGGDFIFPNVETQSSGLMADICANSTNLVNPLIGLTEATYFSTVGISPDECAPLAGEICVLVEKALIQGNSATVHTQEWMRVRTGSAQGRIGFFTERKRVTRSYCGQNEVLTSNASLK